MPSDMHHLRHLRETIILVIPLGDFQAPKIAPVITSSLRKSQYYINVWSQVTVAPALGRWLTNGTLTFTQDIWACGACLTADSGLTDKGYYHQQIMLQRSPVSKGFGPGHYSMLIRNPGHEERWSFVSQKKIRLLIPCFWSNFRTQVLQSHPIFCLPRCYWLQPLC